MQFMHMSACVQKQLHDFDSIFQYSRSPLWAASCNGHIDVVKTLIAAGADVNQADEVSIQSVNYTAGDPVDQMKAISHCKEYAP